MTAAQSRSANSAGQLLLKAMVLSLAAHLAAFGGWKWGQTHAWWKTSSLPVWLQVLPHHLPSTLARTFPAAQPLQPTPLLYVDVDPAMAAAKPPANPKYYSTADTVAANPEKKVPSDLPLIPGTQDKAMKTVAAGARSVPLQPSPPAAEKTRPTEDETTESKALPKPAYTPGDLAEAKPDKKIQEKKGTSESENGADAATQPKHERPRTLEEARERTGAPGPLLRQQGGVKMESAEPAVDAMRTVYGDYDRDFIDAVESRWFELLKDRRNDAGTVKVEFNLHANGRITDMKLLSSDVDELQSLFCEQAVLDPAPFKPWPQKMRQVISDPRQVRFTFYYLY